MEFSLRIQQHDWEKSGKLYCRLRETHESCCVRTRSYNFVQLQENFNTLLFFPVSLRRTKRIERHTHNFVSRFSKSWDYKSSMMEVKEFYNKSSWRATFSTMMVQATKQHLLKFETKIILQLVTIIQILGSSFAQTQPEKIPIGKKK